MNKLYTTLLIACLAAGFTACNDDDCEDLHLGNLAHYPNVLKGTFPTESQVLELGETLEITPELLNPEGAKAPYYLGNFHYAARIYDEAITCWEKSASIDDTYPTVLRNLSLA